MSFSFSKQLQSDHKCRIICSFHSTTNYQLFWLNLFQNDRILMVTNNIKFNHDYAQDDLIEIFAQELTNRKSCYY